MKQITEELHSFSKKHIGLDDLKKIVNAESYAECAGVISELVSGGVLYPVKSSGLNGMIPPLYMKYRIIFPEKDDTAVIAEIQSLHHFIDTKRFLSSPDKYINTREFILTLSDFLKTRSDELNEPMSENERAYSIWHDEKALDSPDNVRLLRECGVFDKLGTYPTPEPFFDYRTVSPPESVLVIENKDTWFTLRKLMIEHNGAISIFGVPFDCVLYGEGKKAAQAKSSVSDYLSLDNFGGQVYYWGDLDYEGIEIFMLVEKVNHTLGVKPFVKMYEKMLDEFEQKMISGRNKNEFRCRKEQRAPKNTDTFFECFDSGTKDRILKLLESGLYIPQEIINCHTMKQLLEIG